jgi:hypothetical protein
VGMTTTVFGLPATHRTLPTKATPKVGSTSKWEVSPPAASLSVCTACTSSTPW